MCELYEMLLPLDKRGFGIRYSCGANHSDSADTNVRLLNSA